MGDRSGSAPIKDDQTYSTTSLGVTSNCTTPPRRFLRVNPDGVYFKGIIPNGQQFVDMLMNTQDPADTTANTQGIIFGQNCDSKDWPVNLIADYSLDSSSSSGPYYAEGYFDATNNLNATEQIVFARFPPTDVALTVQGLSYQLLWTPK